jgi:hypothetical protein
MTRIHRTEVLLQNRLERVARAASCVLLLCSAIVGTAAAQPAKLSEADLRKELESAGRPLLMPSQCGKAINALFTECPGMARPT